MLQSEPPVAAGGSLTSTWSDRLRVLAQQPVAGLALAWVVVALLFALVAPNFLTSANLLNIARASAIAGIAAIAITVPLIAGSLDVSFGAVMSIGSIVAATLISGAWGLVIALVAVLVVGGLLGLVNGLLVVRLRLDALIVTLGTLSIFGGMAFLLTNGAPTRAPGDEFAFLGRGHLLGVRCRWSCGW